MKEETAVGTHHIMTEKAISNKELKERFNSIRKGDDFTDPVEVIPHRKILNQILDNITAVHLRNECEMRYGLEEEQKEIRLGGEVG